MIFFSDDSDPGMRYEGLARAVFQCGAWGGPDHCANQSVYNSAFCPVPNERGRRIMQSIVDKILADGDYSDEAIDQLLDMKNRLNSARQQQDVVQVIDDLIRFCTENGY